MFAVCRMGKLAGYLMLGVLALPGQAQAARVSPTEVALAQATNLLKSVVGTGLPQAASDAQTALNLVLGFSVEITAVPPPPGEVPPNNLQLVQQAQRLLVQAQGQLNASAGASASQANQSVSQALTLVNAYLAQFQTPQQKSHHHRRHRHHRE
jgi:hypothetical protein